jgi:hypothetical protein
MSNKDRIARAALEAEATAKQKTTKKTTAKKTTGTKKTTTKKTAGRIRVVWLLCDQSGSTVRTYAYPREQEVRAEAERLTTKTGKTHFVTRGEVPFDQALPADPGEE